MARTQCPKRRKTQSEVGEQERSAEQPQVVEQDRSAEQPQAVEQEGSPAAVEGMRLPPTMSEYIPIEDVEPEKCEPDVEHMMDFTTFDRKLNTRRHSPTSANGNKRRPSAIWTHVLRLADHAKCSEGFTHICLLMTDGVPCGHLLKSTKNKKKQCWLTNVPNDHFLACHGEHAICRRLAAGRDTTSLNRVRSMDLVGRQGDSTPKLGKTQSSIREHLTQNLTPWEYAISSMARWYLYGKQQLSFATVEDPYFRKMTASLWASSNCPVITAEHLYKFIDAEWAIFMELLKLFVKTQMEASFEQPCLQLLHDAGTLDDHRKREAVGISAVTPDWGKIVTVAIGFLPIEDGSDSALERRLENLCSNRLGYTLDEVICSTMQDRAAMTVAKHLNLESEACAMHDSAKIVESLLGELTRSKNKKVINPFYDCVALMKRVHETVVYYTTSRKRLEKLNSFGANIHGGATDTCFTADTCETRAFLSKTNEVHSLFRKNKLVRMAAIQDPEMCKLKGEDWKDLAEVEACMHVVHPITLLVQFENKYLGGMGAVAVCDILNTLRNGTLKVVDLEQVTKEHGTKKRPFIRKSKHVTEFGSLGREARDRAIIEMQRRFCGSDEEEINVNCVFKMSDRQCLGCALDIRIIVSDKIPISEKQRGVWLLCEEYVKFAEAKIAFDKKLADKSRPAAEDNSGEVDTDDESSELSAPESDKLEWLRDFGEIEIPHETATSTGATVDLRNEFWLAYGHLAAFAKDINWKDHFAELNEGKYACVTKFDAVDDLMLLDIGPIYKKLEEDTEYGLPHTWHGRQRALSPLSTRRASASA